MSRQPLIEIHRRSLRTRRLERRRPDNREVITNKNYRNAGSDCLCAVSINQPSTFANAKDNTAHNNG